MKSKVSRIDVGLLILRIGLGSLFIFYGSQKMFGLFGGRGYSAQVEGFIGGGIPPIFAHLAILAEFLGGLCVLFGFLTPLASFALFCVMVVANFKNMSTPGAWHALMTSGNPQDAARFFYTFALLVMSLALTVMGSGQISLDGKFFRKR